MTESHSRTRTFYEFFAGGGMARAGLGPSWKCLFANDCDPTKAASYRANWGGEELKIADIGSLGTSDLPGRAALAWASFPCQDLSLAGLGAGLDGARSGTFWFFWGLMKRLAREDRAPASIVLENVGGALTSHAGRDFQALAGALAAERYRMGALIIDALHFVPQSRPRLFLVAVHETTQPPARLIRELPDPTWTPAALLAAHRNLPAALKARWIWWNLPAPPARTASLESLLEEPPVGVRWHTQAETARLLALTNELHRKKVEDKRRSGREWIGTIYKRTRPGSDGKCVQRAEIRFDQTAGCLRTPAGGSSRQTVIFVKGDQVRSRLVSPREAARLMGLPESYKLPGNCNQALHLTGDGVVVPAVRHLAAHILEQIQDGG